MTPREEAPVTVTQADQLCAKAIRESLSAATGDMIAARHRTQAAAAAKAREEGLREACERILRRKTEWRSCLANWSGALHMSRKEAEAAALEIDWAAFVIRAALSASDGEAG